MPLFNKLRSSEQKEKKYITPEDFAKRNKEYEEAHERRKNSVREGYRDWSQDVSSAGSTSKGSGGWGTSWL